MRRAHGRSFAPLSDSARTAKPAPPEDEDDYWDSFDPASLRSDQGAAVQISTIRTTNAGQSFVGFYPADRLAHPSPTTPNDHLPVTGDYGEPAPIPHEHSGFRLSHHQYSEWAEPQHRR